MRSRLEPEELLEWAGDDFDPEDFDVEETDDDVREVPISR